MVLGRLVSERLPDMGSFVQHYSGQTVADSCGFSTPGQVLNWPFHPFPDRL
jgi:hypothetical protein